MDDVVLVTIDCWRDDALEAMPTLRAATERFTRGSAICQAPATRGAFPALLAGQYYPQAYADYDTLDPGLRSLPEVLADEGYATGAVVGSNPFLSAWADRFDFFWNDGMAFGTDAEDGPLSGQLSTLRDAVRFATVRSKVTAGDVAARARRWYHSQQGPRFLWVHLMDIHVPFLPGFRRGLSAGLLDTYRTHLRFRDDPEGLTPEEYDHLEALYWESVDYLDEQIRALLNIDPAAATVVVGDHGEEFDHDKYGHARLYEECLSVPLLSSPDLAPHLGAGDTVRQVDVPAGIIDAVGAEIPESWVVDGPPDDPVWPAFALNHSPQFGRVYAAIRTERYKLIQTLGEDLGDPLRTEAYDLYDDPGEQTDVYGDLQEATLLEERLTAFRSRPEIESGLLEHEQEQSAAVEERLEALGYR